MVKLRVGLIGCGVIGTYLARAIDDGVVNADLLVVFDIRMEKSRKLVKSLKKIRPRVAGSIEDLIREDLDVVVEAASQEAVKEYALKIIESGKSLIVLSTGALLNHEFYEELVEAAERHDVKVYLPSGAAGGLDVLKAISLLDIDEFELITRKHPRAFGLEGINGPTVIFEGSPEEAVKRFPLNINVAATLTLATQKKPKVRIVADPSTSENIHEIHASGSFGEVVIKIRSKPTPENPKTSYIAPLSVIQLLRQLAGDRIEVGT